MNHLADIRAHERTYHDALYAPGATTAGTWLAGPAKYALHSFELIPQRPKIQALDLGAGIGRHTIPLANALPIDAHVTAVDLLDSAITGLHASLQTHPTIAHVTPIKSDIETFPWKREAYDYALAIGVLEHLSSAGAVKIFLQDLIIGTRPGGVHCFMVNTDLTWTDQATEAALEPLIEARLTAEGLSDLFAKLYASWYIDDYSTKTWSVPDTHNNRPITATGTCVQFTAVRNPSTSTE